MFRFLIRIVHPEAAVRVLSPEPAQFVDGCVKMDIPLRDLHCEDENTIMFRMRARDFKRMKPIARRTGSRMHVTGRAGLPFKTARLRGRFIFAAGGLFLFLSFFLMTSFIWRIEVVGAETIDERAIERNLAELGISRGALIYGVNISKIVNEMRLRFPALSWFTVNIRGSRAEVLLRERVEPPKIVPANVPCDIIAAKSGVITEMRVYKGEQAAFEGHTVSKGQILVRGHSVTSNGVERFLHSSADVYARTWYTLTAVSPAKCVETNRTGESMTRRAVVLFGRRLNLYGNSGNPFGFCDKITLRKDLSVFGLMLPFAFIREDYLETAVSAKESKVTLSDGKVKEYLEGYIFSRINGKLLNSKFYTTDTENIRYFRLDLEFSELISQETKLNTGSVNIS